jgi:hypothetical protein
MSVKVRPLERSEWRALRDLRLHALRTKRPGGAVEYELRLAPPESSS